ncbi:MAG: LysR family transcriptional regulator [Akkermansiaceae bacterium]|nr:LysR family transcriptional regulator [Akkermansiaceae bacterium]
MEIDLPSILVFRHLAKCRSFTDTGKYWNISQPTVSQMINRLESSLGIILLDRSGNETKLTADGQIFLERANEVCDAYLEFIDGIDALGRRMERKVTVALDRNWYSSVVFSAKDQLRLPDGVIPVFTDVSGNWNDVLESGRADVVLACRFLHSDLSAGIQEALVKREKGITIAWNPEFHHIELQNFKFPDLLRTNVLMPDEGQFPNFLQAIHTWCEQAYGMLPANTETFPSEVEAASAAVAGLGVLLTPGDAIPRLGLDGESLTHIKSFEFLLPEALTLGVYCRSDETNKDVLETATQLGRLCLKLLPED